MTITYQTDRLILRPFSADDCDWIATAMADTDVSRWIPPLPYPYGPDDARAFVAKQVSAAADAVAVTHNGTPVGCITTATELGYWYCKSAWGQGFATEAARAVVGQHFKTHRHDLTSGYMLSNDRSHRVLSKLGFVPTQTVERHSNALDQPVIIQRMVLSRANWEACR